MTFTRDYFRHGFVLCLILTKYPKVIILYKTMILACCSPTVTITVKFSISYVYNLLGIHLPFYSCINSSNMALVNVFQH